MQKTHATASNDVIEKLPTWNVFHNEEQIGRRVDHLVSAVVRATNQCTVEQCEDA